MNARRAIVVLAVVVGWTAALAAQAEFGDRYRAAEKLRLGGEADADTLRSAYRAAASAFELVPTDAAEYASLLPSAAWTAFQAELYPRAAELFGQLIGGESLDEFTVEYRLRSLLRAAQPTACLRAARQFAAGYAEAVDRVLRGAGVGPPALQAEAGRLLRVGETELGTWAFRRMAAASQEHPVALGNLALALRFLGQAVECEALYRQALARSPNDGVLWNDLGLFLKGAGRFDEAGAAFRRSLALESRPGVGPATTNLLLLSRNDGQARLPNAGVALAAVLRDRPSAALPRRLCLDRVLAR